MPFGLEAIGRRDPGTAMSAHSSGTQGDDYVAKHDLARTFAELTAALALARPARPLDAAVAGLRALSERRERGEAVADYASLFAAIFSEAPTRAPAHSQNDVFAGFSWEPVGAPLGDAGGAPGDAGGAHNDSGVHEALSEAPSHTGPSDAQVRAAAAAASAGPALPPPAGFSAGRRFSISAEPYTPSAERPFHRVVVPKGDATKARIRAAVRDNLLFRSLDAEQLAEIVDAMFEKRVAPGAAVIRQGDEGDFFYVIEAGAFEVVRDGERVVTLGPGEAFGELALMYGHPRMASVHAAADAGEHVLWAVDRTTFRCIVIDLSFRKRRLYESFLRTVPLLETLFDHEIHRICDALQPVSYSAGAVIVAQGDVGHDFFVLEDGTAAVHVRAPQSVPGGQGDPADSTGDGPQVATIGRGDYFGELALLRDAPRAATVRALTDVRCVSLSKADFIRLLGPVMPILQRNQEHYRRYEEYLGH